jgi:hypothetical protein
MRYRVRPRDYGGLTTHDEISGPPESSTAQNKKATSHSRNECVTRKHNYTLPTMIVRRSADYSC